MIQTGRASIDYLANEAGKGDQQASSHWRKYHSDFEFRGDGFAGLLGFGGNGSVHTGLRGGMHRLLQRPFRAMGEKLPKFTAIDALAREITHSQQRGYDLDVLRQVLTLAFLTKHLPAASAAPSLSPTTTACVIGDGFASMTALLLASRSAQRVVLINLTKTLLVDLWYLKLWMGDEVFNRSVDLVTDEVGVARALATPVPASGPGRVIAIQAVHHELLRACPVDVAINIVSMQEMDPPVIAGYFADLRGIKARRALTFYCCNREEKVLPDGTVTRIAEYPWQPADRMLVDELCPWHQQYYSLKPPFFRPYDGPIRHRLVALAPAGSDQETSP